jgi:hypothetical protein
MRYIDKSNRFSFPRAGVGTPSRRICRGLKGTLARPDWVPTPARGNQKVRS